MMARWLSVLGLCAVVARVEVVEAGEPALFVDGGDLQYEGGRDDSQPTDLETKQGPDSQAEIPQLMGIDPDSIHYHDQSGVQGEGSDVNAQQHDTEMNEDEKKTAEEGFRSHDFDCEEENHRGMALARMGNVEDTPENRKKSVTRLFMKLDECFKKHDISSWHLYGGSLIGVVRPDLGNPKGDDHPRGGFISWDQDGDIAITDSDFSKLQRVASTISKTCFELAKPQIYLDVFPKGCYGGPGPRETLPARLWDSESGFYIDIFALTESAEGEFSNEDISGSFKASKDLIFPVKDCGFDKLTLRCPAQPREYLDIMFGGRDKWAVPDHPNYDTALRFSEVNTKRSGRLSAFRHRVLEI